MAAPSICPSFHYRDAKAAIAFLKEAFGFREVTVHPGEGDVIMHAELAYGNGMVMLGSAGKDTDYGKLSPELGPSSVYVVVEDTDAHFRRAVAAGAEIVMPVTDQDYGSRDYTARDPEGNLWSFGTYMPEIPAPA